MTQTASDRSANRRAYTRVITQFPVLVRTPQETAHGTVRDLSMNGAYVECVCGIATGSACSVELNLTGSEPPVAITCTGSVIRADAMGLAITFDSIHGADSFTHLRNVILYNCGDPERAMEEIAENSWVRRGIAARAAEAAAEADG
jgi:hypothetical protein